MKQPATFISSIPVHRVMRFDPVSTPVSLIDLSAANPRLDKVDIDDEISFTRFIDDSIHNAGAEYGAGGYAENRVIYRRSEVFEGDRCIHLGIDLWADDGECVFAPLDGVIHSFRDNASHGDYGPTIILEHVLDQEVFYTLYGHLSRDSLKGKRRGDKIQAGETFAWLGNYEENVHWPPHLHFQVITDLLGKEGDFPGVARPSEAGYYLSLCPDPNLILRIPALNDNEVGPDE